MPNRIIKESICSSEKIASLTDFEFRLWVGLITQADDSGRGDARPAIIKGHVFPLRDRVTSKDIEAAVHGLAAKGCVSLYTVGGKPYFWFPSWGEHQRIRDVKPKFPGPDEADDIPPQSAADCGRLPPKSNPIQSESESISESKESDFDAFWAAYPRKVGKADARKAFKKVKAPMAALLTAIDRQKQSDQWQKNGGQYIPNPSTWLNQGRWEDELPTTSGGGRVPAGSAGTSPLTSMEREAVARMLAEEQGGTYG